MKRQGLQELVKSIFSNENVRSEFNANPQAVMANYRLTTTEKKAVLSPRMVTVLAADNRTLLAETDALENWW